MDQIAELLPPRLPCEAPALPCGTPPLPRGRPTKFTPEKIRQVSNLVERGKSREEIAELVGVTVGTLQVTCSRLGISLRKPRYDTGTGLLRQSGSRTSNGASTPNPISVEPNSCNGTSGLNSISGGDGQLPKMHEDSSASFAVRMRYKGGERTTEVPLTHDMIGQLAIEAELRNMKIGQLVSEIIVAVTKGDLFQLVLNKRQQTKA
jgi:Helix-turn-helix domain of resolvase